MYAMMSAGSDPYAPQLLEEILAQKHDWIKVDDVVQMALKAVC